MARRHKVPRSPACLVVNSHFKKAIRLNLHEKYGLYEGITAIALPLHELCVQHHDAFQAMWDVFMESLESVRLREDDEGIWDIVDAKIIEEILDGNEDPLPTIAEWYCVHRSTAGRWCTRAMDALLEYLLPCLVFVLTECGMHARAERVKELFPLLL